MSGYNGWKNKETWLVNLWFGDYFTDLQEEGQNITEDYIREMVEEFTADKLEGNGFLVDMLNCALGEIDYRELAAHYVAEEE